MVQKRCAEALRANLQLLLARSAPPPDKVGLAVVVDRNATIAAWRR